MFRKLTVCGIGNAKIERVGIFYIVGVNPVTFLAEGKSDAMFLSWDMVLYMTDEGLDSANQLNGKLDAFDRKLEANHSIFILTHIKHSLPKDHAFEAEGKSEKCVGEENYSSLYDFNMI